MNTDLVPKTILLADDDYDDAEMFAHVLTEIDSSIAFHHMENGLAIFEYLKDKHNRIPDVIFLDINMPQMNGWQCLAALKNDPVTQHTSVIIYSTSSHHRDKQTALELGATAFISKPSEYKSLQNILSTIVSELHHDLKKAIEGLII